MTISEQTIRSQHAYGSAGGIYPAVWLVRIQRWFCIGSRRFGSSRIRHNCRFLRSCNAVLDVCDVVVNKKPTFVGACTGMVAGLVGITPGAGFVPIWAALIIGLTTSPICFFMISWVKEKFGYDDALDAFGCHGVGGIWGGICTGLFCKVSINDIGQGNGLFFGDTKLFLMQLASIGITIVVSVAGTLICYGITRLVTGKIRVTEREERVGLDRSQHGESAYPSFNGLD